MENFVNYFNHSGYSQCHHSFAVSNDHCLWMSNYETWTFKKKLINNTEPMLCALINQPNERDVHSICSGVKFLPKDGFHDNDCYLLPPTEKSSAITGI